MKLFWHQAPLMRLAIPFILGIFIGLRIPESGRSFLVLSWAVCLLLTLSLVLLRPLWKTFRYNFIFGLGISLIFFGMGFGRVQLKYDAPQWAIPESDRYVAFVRELPLEKPNSIRVFLDVTAYRDSVGSLHSFPMKAIGYFAKDSSVMKLRPGDEIVFHGTISAPESPKNPHQFDFGKYLRFQGISGTVYVGEGEFSKTGHVATGLLYRIQNLRADIIERYERYGFDVRETGVISALLLGERNYLDSDLRDAFANAGAVHILAVSGLHVGIIYLFALSLFSKILRGKRLRILRFLLILSLLWFYAAITGFSPSVLRAATMFSFIALGKHFGKYLDIYNMIFASALLLLAINPFLLSQVGFQLSYIAVLGIIFLHPKIYALLYFPNWLPDKVWSLLVVSFCAQLATFPLSVHYFNQFPTYFFITNLIVIPLAWVILHSGIIWLMVFWIPWIGDVFAYLTFGATYVLNYSVIAINGLPDSVITGIYFSGFTVLVLYVFMLSGIQILRKPGKFRLRAFYILTLLLVGIYSFKSISRTRQERLMVPADAPGAVAVVISGRESIVYTHNLEPADTSKILYLIEGELCAAGVRARHWQEIQVDSSPTAVPNRIVYRSGVSDEYTLESDDELIYYITDWAVFRSVLNQNPTATIAVSGRVRLRQETFDTLAYSGSIHYLPDDGPLAIDFTAIDRP